MDPDTQILEALSREEGKAIDSFLFATSLGLAHAQVVGAAKSLEAEGYVICDAFTSEHLILTEESVSYVADGSPEAQLFQALPSDGGTSEADLESLFSREFVSIAKGKCLKNKWIVRDPGSGLYKRLVPAILKDELVEQLLAVRDGTTSDEKLAKELQRRKLVEKIKRTTFKIVRGHAFAPLRRKLYTDISKEMLDTGEWEKTVFKEYNFEALGREPGGGHVHALMKVRAEFRQILLEMGFAEMPTDRFVESSFWNFDSLFQPQSHPSRDMHDTFFLAAPARSLSLPAGYVRRVQDIHEHGGFGSLGYGYNWSVDEAFKNVLRTHTTAVSSRMLYKLANQPGGFKPAKLFSIDRVFRNESLDATHLAEFHQVEGVVADYNLSLGDLIGLIQEFFRRIGITRLRFKPAFNPYTEPSMEIFGYHPDLKKWTEIGNSGMFRPEMLRPMGFPDNVRVIAWGLSLERPTMIKYRCKNIRELFGHKVRLDLARSQPICRFEVPVIQGGLSDAAFPSDDCSSGLE